MTEQPDQSPLERLDAAVQEFVNGLPEHEGAVLTGWALCFQVANATDDGRMWWDTQYATGPSTNPATAVGVTRLAETKMRRDLDGYAEPEDDDDPPA